MTLVTRTRIELIFLLFAISSNIEFCQVLCGVLGDLSFAVFSHFKRFLVIIKDK